MQVETGIKSINVGGRLLELSRPLVMGVLNVTPDSFHSASRVSSSEIGEAAARMVADGADILDIGACSTRPGADMPTASEEMSRLLPALEAVRERCPEAVISIDTFRASVARECVGDFGADIINDISGGDMDPEMWSAVADMGVPYVLMHTRGEPSTMTRLTDYADVTAEVLRDLARKTDALRQLGVCDVIVDPGFGFAKTLEQNYELLANLRAFEVIGAPILVGMSRKKMIQRAVGEEAGSDGALYGTLAAHTLAMANGADIIRVHDVRAAAAAAKVFAQYRRAIPATSNQIVTQDFSPLI